MKYIKQFYKTLDWETVNTCYQRLSKQTLVFAWLDIVTTAKKNEVCHNHQRVRYTQEQLIGPGPKPPPCYPPSTPGLPL